MEEKREQEKHHKRNNNWGNRGNDCLINCHFSDEVIPVKKVTLYLNGRTYEVSSLAQAIDIILKEGKKEDDKDGKL